VRAAQKFQTDNVLDDVLAGTVPHIEAMFSPAGENRSRPVFPAWGGQR
jgi:hypothetical protein